MSATTKTLRHYEWRNSGFLINQGCRNVFGISGRMRPTFIHFSDVSIPMSWKLMWGEPLGDGERLCLVFMTYIVVLPSL